MFFPVSRILGADNRGFFRITPFGMALALNCTKARPNNRAGGRTRSLKHNETKLRKQTCSMQQFLPPPAVR
jgi:hypothetical protein